MKLGNICEQIVDCEHKTAPTQEAGYPSIRTPNIGCARFILDTVNRVSENTYRQWTRRAVPRPGDLIMAREAPVGNVAMIPEGLQPCLGQRTLLIRCDRNKAVPAYVCYLLNGPEVQGTIYGMTNGATVPHLNMADVRTLPIPELPPLPTQRKIAAILSAYDDLIENNERRIKILKEMAQNLYREWFVKFRFPGHEKVKMVDSPMGKIPEGWEVKKLGDKMDLLYGKALKEEDRSGGDVPVFGSSGIVGHHNKPLVSAPCIIVGRKGNVGSVYFSFKDCWPIDTVFFIATEMNLYYIFYVLRHQTFLNNDAAVPGLNRNAALAKTFIVPSEPLLSDFDKLIRPFFSFFVLLKRRNANLRQTRDLLLPRLISGEVDVSEVDIKECQEKSL